MKKKVLFIINPIAGVKRKDKLPRLIDAALDHVQYTYDIVYTEHRGHATEIAERAIKDGVEVVAVAGGDGSVNEVAMALRGTSVKLAILPYGSGNGLARALGNPMKIAEAVRLINTGKVRAVDTAKVNDHVFFSLIGIGFDAFAVKVFDREEARGFLAYAWAAIRSLSAYQSYSFVMDCDGVEYNGAAFLINICNSNQYGYNVRIAPFAEPDDGLLDVVLVRDLPKWKAVWLVFLVLMNKHHNSRMLEFIKARKVHLQTSRHAYMQVDGETMHKDKQFDVQICIEQLQVLVKP